MSILKNLYTQQHEIEITQNGHTPSIKVNGNEINGLSTSLNLDISLDAAPRLTIGLISTKVLTKINSIVDFEHEGKIYRLIEVKDDA